MRSAIVATPAHLPDQRPAPGALDGDLLRSRLPLPDAGFKVIDLDPGRDLAEQLDILFDTNAPEAGSPILFYASCGVALAVDGEVFLCLNPADLQTGDSLKDIASVLRDRHDGPLLLIVECRHADGDAARSAAVVKAAKAMIDPKSGVELLVAAHPLATGDDDLPSPFTRALVEALDDADPAKGLTAQDLYEGVRSSGKLADGALSFAYVRGKSAFELIPPDPIAAGKVAADEAPQEEERTSHPPESASASASASASSPAPSADEPAHSASESAAPSGEPHASAAAYPRRLRRSDKAPAAEGDDEHPPESMPISLSPESLAPVSLPPESIPVNVSFETTGLVNLPPDLAADTALETTGVPVSFETTSSVPVSFELTGSVPISLDSLESIESAQASSETPDFEIPADVEPTFADHLKSGDKLADANDPEGALREYKNALGLLAPDAARLRAEIYFRIAKVKAAQKKRRDAIAQFEKAIQAFPEHRKAIEGLVDLTFQEEDWSGLASAEERLLGLLANEDERFTLLVTYAERWGGVALDAERARALLERARELRPADRGLLTKLRMLYEAIDLIDEAIEMRRRLAELTDDGAERGREYLEIGRYCLEDLKREPLALELLDAALDADPTNIEPLAIVERILEERQEWHELEQVYRRMIERLELCPKGKPRTEASWDICRRLAFLHRDHLEDPGSALLAFQDAITHKPDDLDSHCVAAELARTTGRLEQAVAHLQAMAVLDPSNTSTFHDLFEVFQKLRRPDQAYSAACVTMFLKSADARERIIYEEHAPQGTPDLTHALGPSAWSLLRTGSTDPHVEAILDAVAPAAVSAKIALLDEEERLPLLDPEARQDPKTSTVSIVRSFVWGSHFLGVPAPSVYIREDASQLTLAAVMAEEPSVVIGGLVLRGRSMPELAFLVGRHLAYHVGSHRLLLYYPSLDELSICFLSALRVAIPSLPIPANFREAVMALAPRLEAVISVDAVKRIQRTVAELDAAGRPADITRWVSGVEHCAARAGYLLCGDLDTAAQIIRTDPLGMVRPDEKVAGIVSFTVSDAYHTLRQELGIAIEP